jgi:hypothetical protein
MNAGRVLGAVAGSVGFVPKGPALLYVAGVPRGYEQPQASYDKLVRIDVQPGEQALTELVFEIDKTK